MTVVAENSNPSHFPIRHGSLSVSATSQPPAAPSDVYAAVVDRENELSLALLCARVGKTRCDEARTVALAREALGITKVALEKRAPMYDIVSALRSLTATERPCHLATAIVRFAQADSRVEILNAGMPPVTCVLPNGEICLHPALSFGIGERFGEVHPYELAPLAWGSTWLIASDGLTRGEQSPQAVKDLWRSLEISAQAQAFALASGDEISRAVQSLLDREPRSPNAALLAVHADPTRRFRSGIRGSAQVP